MSTLKSDTILVIVEAPALIEIEFDLSSEVDVVEVSYEHIEDWFYEQPLFIKASNAEKADKPFCLPISDPEKPCG